MTKMTDLIEIEKEVLEEIVEARENIRETREAFPSGIDKAELIKRTIRTSKNSRYFTDAEKGAEYAEKEKLIVNPATVSTTFDIGVEAKGTSEEYQKDAEDAEQALGVITLELSKRLAEELDRYLSDYPSMKVAEKLVMVADDVRCIRDVLMNPLTFEPIVRLRFVLKLNIYVG